jgi:hypothetical protein
MQDNNLKEAYEESYFFHSICRAEEIIAEDGAKIFIEALRPEIKNKLVLHIMDMLDPIEEK